ncbi:hypothetical protein VTN77DRAFT_8218 [Rasamsonia byssochlamydoides]|uniref:uncharacterized protein n=1 Tax=Rasamsonia byssochlamydoides TaxID=89139 RepID=UPI0037427F12
MECITPKNVIFAMSLFLGTKGGKGVDRTDKYDSSEGAVTGRDESDDASGPWQEVSCKFVTMNKPAGRPSPSAGGVVGESRRPPWIGPQAGRGGGALSRWRVAVSGRSRRADDRRWADDCSQPCQHPAMHSGLLVRFGVCDETPTLGGTSQSPARVTAPLCTDGAECQGPKH